MLSSIHPFGERSRSNSFGLTATAHIIGSTVGGLALGAIAGFIGLVISFVFDPGSAFRTTVVLLAALVAVVVEATGRERLLPSRTRQVDENWIQTYRGWVYGGGWGVELGFGVSTIITTSLVHLLVVAMVLADSAVGSLLLGATFGFTRGATILTVVRVDSPEQLRRFHQGLARTAGAFRSGAVLSLVVVTAFGLSAVL